MPADVYTPTVTDKLWGKTRCIQFGNHIEIWHASIRKGGYSSKHCHTKKFNDFYVVSGELEVEFYLTKDAAVPYKIALLKAGQRLTTDLNEWHRFRALTDVELIENYWNTIDPTDIERHDEGGCDDGTQPAAA